MPSGGFMRLRTRSPRCRARPRTEPTPTAARCRPTCRCSWRRPAASTRRWESGGPQQHPGLIRIIELKKNCLSLSERNKTKLSQCFLRNKSCVFLSWAAHVGCFSSAGLQEALLFWGLKTEQVFLDSLWWWVYLNEEHFALFASVIKGSRRNEQTPFYKSSEVEADWRRAETLEV